MGLEINAANSNNYENTTSGETVAKEPVKLNTIFDIDAIGNRNGEVDMEDFQLAFTDKNFESFRDKIENLYVEFMTSFKLAKEETIGSHIKTAIDIPFQTPGITQQVEITTDAKSGKVLMKKTSYISEEDGITTVKTKILHYNKNTISENEVSFQYNKKLLEEYIINEAKDNFGITIDYFKDIPAIRALPEEERSDEQKNLLEEFNNLVNYSINAGVEYGIDPKLVLSIIQQEVGFNGINSSATGKNGKGYMQLTSAPIKDYLGFSGDGKYHSLKTVNYGPEMEELLASRNFDVNAATSQEEKQALYRRIYNYLKENKDPDFNIRMGTLVLRNYMNRSDGDIKRAARNYNGNPALRDKYSRYVVEYHENMEDTVPKDSTYIHKKFQIT